MLEEYVVVWSFLGLIAICLLKFHLVLSILTMLHFLGWFKMDIYKRDHFHFYDLQKVHSVKLAERSVANFFTTLKCS